MTTTTSGTAPGATSGKHASTAARRQGLGRYGEDVAARHLTEAGLVLLARNWRCDEGEIDLVLRDGDTLVVGEVKTRSSTAYGTPHEAITDDKLDRLQRLGLRFAESHGLRPAGIRIDLVAVLRPRRGPALVEHVRGLL